MTIKRRIALVGPFPPTRGGVARHTASVARSLEARSELRTWRFRKQYPQFLYPGTSERSEDAPEDNLGGLETLSGVNPISWMQTVQQIRAWQPDTIVSPAWTFFLAPALGAVARWSGAENCIIVHNAFDHEASGWKARIGSWQLAAADRFVTHNQSLADELNAHFPKIPTEVFPHPIFDDFPDATGSLKKRKPLELLFFGLVRPYKGLDVLLEAMAKLERKDVMLTVAGEIWGDKSSIQRQIDRLGISDRVELVPRFVTDAEAAEFFDRSDLVVLPYRSVTGSGVVANAYHYGRGVIASDLPGLSEIVEHGETGWLFECGNASALADRIDGLSREQAQAVGVRAAKFGKTLSWDRFADCILGVQTEN